MKDKFETIIVRIVFVFVFFCFCFFVVIVVGEGEEGLFLYQILANYRKAEKRKESFLFCTTTSSYSQMLKILI